jgi:DNA-binding CsgD family transcriptional regulator
MDHLLDGSAIEAASPMPQEKRTPAAAAEAGAELLAMLIDELAHGALIVNPQRWILQVNLSAHRELRKGVVLSNERGRLTACCEAGQAMLDEALQKASLGQRSLIGLKNGAAVFSVAVVPLNRRNAGFCENIALFFSRPDLHESAVFSAFARSQRLTRTEQQVLALLCRCLSTPEIAVEMAIAVSTVRSHVRSLCAKTQTSGVRELVNRLSVLPPLAPVLAEPAHQPAGRPPVSLPLYDSLKIH